MRYGSGKALIERLGRIKSRLPNINSISFGECGLSKFKDFDKEWVKQAKYIVFNRYFYVNFDNLIGV